MPRLALPREQRSTAVGRPKVRGGSAFASGTYWVSAGGVDIWDRADQFHFVYQPVTGNLDIIARVVSVERTHAWAKAGVMVRESLAAGSRHATMLVSASRGYAFQRRPDTGVYTDHTAGGTGSAPGWVRLVRTGDLFEAFRSDDGRSWLKVGSANVPMGETVYVGLAATSHDETTLTTAVFDSLAVTHLSPLANQPPAVSIVEPAGSLVVTLPATVTVTAAAIDPEDRLLSVEFYADSTLIGRRDGTPHSIAWAPSAPGVYTLTAVAHDQDGGRTVSAAVRVTVQEPGNSPPTVSLAASLTSSIAPGVIALAANASDPEGQLARVEFFSGSSRLASDASAPYSFTWNDVPAGTYRLTAVAYDALGASATSTAVTLTVGAPLVGVTPTTVVFQASADHDAYVIHYVFEVFAAGANPATAAALATADLGKPAPIGGEIAVRQDTLFHNLAPGTYLATVSAVGSGGRSRSEAVTFTR